MKPCGTEAAYYRHRYRGEEPCPEDRAAVAAAERRRARTRGRRPRRAPRHGTNSRYTGGCRCAACREAHAEYQAEWRAGVRGRRRERVTVVECIRDVAETFWPDALSTVQLVERVLDLHPEWNPKTVHRILWRDSRLVRQSRGDEAYWRAPAPSWAEAS